MSASSLTLSAALLFDKGGGTNPSIKAGFNETGNLPLVLPALCGDHAEKILQTVGPTPVSIDLSALASLGLIGLRVIELVGSAAAPTGPAVSAVTPQGTPGSNTYGYRAVGRFEDGSYTLPGARVNTATGNATLDNTNYNLVAWANIGLFDSFDLYRLMPPAETNERYVRFKAAFAQNEIDAAAQGAPIIEIDETGGGFSFKLSYDFSAAHWVYAIGGSSQTYSGSAPVAGVYNQIDIKIAFGGGGVTITPRFDAVDGTPVTSGSWTDAPNELHFGATDDAGSLNHRFLTQLRVGYSTYGSAEIFSAFIDPDSAPALPLPFDSMSETAVVLSVVAGGDSMVLVAENAGGHAYLVKAIMPLPDLVTLLGNFATDLSSHQDKGGGTASALPSAAVAPTRPCVKFTPDTALGFPAKTELGSGEFSIARLRGSEIHCLAATPVLTEIVAIEDN